MCSVQKEGKYIDQGSVYIVTVVEERALIFVLCFAIIATGSQIMNF